MEEVDGEEVWYGNNKTHPPPTTITETLKDKKRRSGREIISFIHSFFSDLGKISLLHTIQSLYYFPPPTLPTGFSPSPFIRASIQPSIPVP